MMAGEVKFDIRGAKEMNELLNKLGPQVASRVADQALRAGAKLIVDEAKRLVPVGRTGNLRDSIIAQRQRRTGEDQRVILIGFDKDAPGSPSSRAHLVEFGTAHSAAKPFMRPAMDSQAANALGEMGKVLARGITREARKLAKPR
jgi:HK97 gp10 family phage protein